MANYLGSEQDADLDQLFRALGDRNRRRILERLAANTTLTVGELSAPLDISKSTVSRHLKVLEGVGLLRRHVFGRIHGCQTDPQGLERARTWIERYRESCEHSSNTGGRIRTGTPCGKGF